MTDQQTQQPGTQPAPPIQQPQPGTQPAPSIQQPQPGTQPAPQTIPQAQPRIVQDYATGNFGVYHPDKQIAEDASSAYQAIIAQQNAQIEALIAQTNAQSQQITQMVQNGAQFQQAPQLQPQQTFIPQQPQPQPVQFPSVYQPSDDGAHPLSTFNPPALADDHDYSLEGLASEIGKRSDNG